MLPNPNNAPVVLQIRTCGFLLSFMQEASKSKKTKPKATKAMGIANGIQSFKGFLGFNQKRYGTWTAFVDATWGLSQASIIASLPGWWIWLDAGTGNGCNLLQ